MVVRQKQRFQQGDIICAEGSHGDCAYIVESGRVEIFVGSGVERVTLSILGVGEIFGEMAVIDGSPRSASAVALEPCELMSVSSEAISERIKNADPIVRLLVAMLLKRMRHTNESTKKSRHEEEEETTTGSSGLAQEVIDKIRIEAELKPALAANEFALHFQPVMDLQKMQIAGFEALIRWRSSNRGLVQPDIFMGIAEETSLIVPIGRWVLENACAAHTRIISEMKANGLNDPIFMSINISSRQFHDPQFFDHLTEVVQKNGLRHDQIKLEVTERIFMEGPAAIYAIERCRSLGFPIALDDFGTGYSSLSYLAKFQVDTLKVDKAFVQLLIEDPRTYTITAAIVDMANQLGIQIIAEGVETVEECASLQTMNCRYGQGFLFSPAMPLPDALNFIKAHKAIGAAS
ncbi:MAG TPA: EAL domain-containing protein [Oligoflexus sp.]|uniref:EAL domain-containing protein n=1 Tax=Oligoflexus sp. TaxID=1971216 RepID=UPI002D47E416|nr:EAL domain-containing protein [Oligoflexus sp.]HYX32974.1 EAL domain-containing protein [Oligoflexus sp.]